uniref:flavin-containing monooxygenase n=1 Tax=Thaumasiovibrio occultus TaxID=1891184 RepID=UPI000B34C7A4|nr:NAD(P)/FAD-dependent oxidoreductase [Thaumasiovibrio occultus]
MGQSVSRQINTLIIGAGHSGLAAAYQLKQRGIEFLIVDAKARVGDNWRKRFTDLTLFTPNGINQLPGFVAPQSRGEFQTKDEFADYLEDYATLHGLPVNLNERVVVVRQSGKEGFYVETDKARYQAERVVIATGAFKDGYRPVAITHNDVAQYDVAQLALNQFERQSILVVGDGASGRQVAKSLARNNRVSLAQGTPRNLIKPKILGLSIFHWLRALGLLRLPKRFKLAKWLKQRDPFPDTAINDSALQRAGVRLLPKLVEYTQVARFANGANKTFDAVVWATGYRNRYDYIELAGHAIDPLRLENGDYEAQGLYAIGMAWQHNRASGLIYGAEFESTALANKLCQPNRLVR